VVLFFLLAGIFLHPFSLPFRPTFGRGKGKEKSTLIWASKFYGELISRNTGGTQGETLPDKLESLSKTPKNITIENLMYVNGGLYM